MFATATTGLAACHLKGTTLQQFAGIGKARGSGPELLKVVKKRPDALRRWKTAQVCSSFFLGPYTDLVHSMSHILGTCSKLESVVLIGRTLR